MIGSAGLSGCLAPASERPWQAGPWRRRRHSDTRSPRCPGPGCRRPGVPRSSSRTSRACPCWARPTSQPLAAVEIHHAGRRGLDAHLVLDGAAAHGVRSCRGCRPRSAGLSGTRNRLMPCVPAGAPGRRASTRWMMFSVRSCSPAEMKILVAGDRVAAVGGRLGRGAHEAEIGAALGLGQAHGAGPCAGRELGQIERLECLAGTSPRCAL